MNVKNHFVLKLFVRNNDQHNQMLYRNQVTRHTFHDCFSKQNQLHLSIQVHLQHLYLLRHIALDLTNPREHT